MTLEEELFTVSSNIHQHKNRTSLKGPPSFFSPSPSKTSAFLINCDTPNRSFFLVNTFSLTDRESERRERGEGRGKRIRAEEEEEQRGAAKGEWERWGGEGEGLGGEEKKN